MEKQCELCNNLYKAEKKTQKFCSIECQYQSYRKPKIDKVITTCNFCGVKFSILPNKLLNGKGKYCCRECKDGHQTIIYSGSNNPIYGVKHSDEWKKNRSTQGKMLWKSQDYRNKIKEGVNRYVEKNGHYPGSDKESQLKRQRTMMERYGVLHNWNGKYGERICDKTTLKLYGETSVDMLMNYSHFYGKKTDIEQMFEQILEECNIPFQTKYRIYNEQKINFWYKEYDFLIVNTNILIEVDGDYWHGNEKIFEELSDFQKTVKLSDEIKEVFAKNKGYKVIRFWGSEIKENRDKIKNKLNEIWGRLK